MKRAYSKLIVKEIDADQRVIRGIATTPTPDRMGDIVDSSGAKFALPMPLLWQHQHDKPIGQVTNAEITEEGISVEAKLMSPDGLSGPLAERLDTAWQSIKSGLVKGLSIGFRPIEYAFLDDGGMHFTKWEWYELSAVTIPANAETTIQSIKAIDQKQRAASGSTHPKRRNKVNFAEQLKNYEATRAEKLDAMAVIMESASEDSATLDDEQTKQYDALDAEVKALDDHIARIKRLVDRDVKTAKPVKSEAGSRVVRVAATAKNTQKLEKGIAFARMAMCIGAAKGNLTSAQAIAQHRYPDMDDLNTVMKSAVTAGTTTDSDWASKLVEYNQIATDFVEYLRPRTIIGQFGQGGIPSLRPIPFNVHVRGQTNASVAGWVGEGKHKPVTSGKYTDVYLGWAKLAAISVATDELLRFSNPAAERLIRDDLASAVISQMDKDFIQITNSGNSGVKPAAITYEFNGSATVIPSGSSNPEADIAGLWSIADTGNLDVSSAVFITTPAVVRKLMSLVTAADNRRFPDVTINGGSINGTPVIVSNYVDTNAFILAFANEIWLADEGMVTIDLSREASIIMDTDPEAAISAATPGETLRPQSVSMFQTNSVAFRAERYINWQTRRADVVNAISASSWA